MRLIHILCLSAAAVALLPAAPLLAQAVGAETGGAETAPPGVAQAEVDESALRYFARTGDARRLAAETARLKALHPDWQPPADPLADPGPGDPKIDALWRLYAQGRHAELRALMAQYAAEDPEWTSPPDLMSQLALAEARTRLVNASDLGQSRTVVEVAQANPGLLTCQDLDLMWRLAAAFAQTGRADRAADAYRYVLDNCAGGADRLATLQKAGAALDRAAFDGLLAHALANPAAADPESGAEIERVRLDLARQAVAAAGPQTPVDAAEVARVEAAFAAEGRASDALLLGWADYRRARPAEAGAWFQRARAAEDSADAAIGLGLVALSARDYAGAEAALAAWRDASDEARAAYLAAATNLLAGDPPTPIDEAVLARIVPAVTDARDAAAAAQLGWYARAFGQPSVAEQWFATALAWKPGDETAAYGLALSRKDLGRTVELAALQRDWTGRSDRIAAIGAGPVARAGAGRASGGGTGGGGTGGGGTGGGGTGGGGGGSLASGWRLLDSNRPLEAASAFGAALASSSQATREEAAYGQSLAYLRLGLIDQAAVAAVSAPQSPKRAAELQATILADRAVAAFGQGRYAETLTALDQRGAVARERIDLMVLRGYANLKLNRRKEAERVFAAAAGTGSAKAAEGLALARKPVQASR